MTRNPTRNLQGLRLVAITATILILGISSTTACKFSIGYFYQVTNLRGAVVGK